MATRASGRRICLQTKAYFDAQFLQLIPLQLRTCPAGGGSPA
ncbi:hypothetical protein [Streptomyces sp. NPDC001135]